MREMEQLLVCKNIKKTDRLWKRYGLRSMHLWTSYYNDTFRHDNYCKNHGGVLSPIDIQLHVNFFFILVLVTNLQQLHCLCCCCIRLLFPVTFV